MRNIPRIFIDPNRLVGIGLAQNLSLCQNANAVALYGFGKRNIALLPKIRVNAAAAQPRKFNCLGFDAYFQMAGAVGPF